MRPTGPGWSDPADRTRLTHLSVHGGADEQLSVVLQEDWTHVEYDPVVVLTLWRRPEQSPPLLPGPGQVPHHQLTTGHTHRNVYSNKPRILTDYRIIYCFVFVSGMILNVTFILYWNQLNSVWTWSSWTRVVSVVPWASGHGARVSLWLRGRPQSLFSSHTAASESSHLQRAGDKRRHRGLHRVPSAVRFMFCGSELLFHRFYLDKKTLTFSLRWAPDPQRLVFAPRRKIAALPISSRSSTVGYWMKKKKHIS